MIMKSYFECNLFEEDFILEEKFIVTQKELCLKEKLEGRLASFEKKTIEYKCNWSVHENWDSNKPCLLIPIRDNKSLLEVTIKNLVKNKVNKQANIIIIDDRSEEDLKTISTKTMSYLRVDNEKGFNFSMLNNIAAKICDSLGAKEIVLWNVDLWVPNKDTFTTLMKKHRENNSLISGSKLLYPPKTMSLNNEEDTENIRSINKDMLSGKWRETVQFGGDSWVLTPHSSILLSPIHNQRFRKANSSLVNCDRGVTFLTGALHVWNLAYYIKLGGLNPSLSRNFQDVDMCLKSVELENIPLYFGKDLFFYHDESAVMNNTKGEVKHNPQMESDHILFGKIWNEKIMKIVY